MSIASLTVKLSTTAESDHETFRYMSGAYVFDVTRAIAFVQDGREPVELDEDDVRFSLKRVSIDKKYLPKVDTSRPGIVPWSVRRTNMVSL